jgi:hypothetical protein
MRIDSAEVKKAVDEVPESALREVYDYLAFLKWRTTRGEIEFDARARNLAKEKGFDHLTEQDIAGIVKGYRNEQNNKG